MQTFPFEVEPAYYVEDAPRVIAEEGGRATIEDRLLTNGEKVLSVVIGAVEYPLIGDVDLLAEEGDDVEEGTVLAERPVDELCSKTGYEMLVDRYGASVQGVVLDQEILDSLVFLVTRIRDPKIPIEIGDRLSFLEKRALGIDSKQPPPPCSDKEPIIVRPQCGHSCFEAVVEQLDLFLFERLGRIGTGIHP